MYSPLEPACLHFMRRVTGGGMAHWALSCKNCGKSFVHSKIEDTFENLFLASKPEFPSEGQELECPHCGTRAVYGRHELIFQSE
jgi:DNA-directed RNA polymerase subunit RPC12/RpoP